LKLTGGVAKFIMNKPKCIVLNKSMFLKILCVVVVVEILKYIISNIFYLAILSKFGGQR
jgi:hypothetical protein